MTQKLSILIMILALCGCATGDWNSFMYGHPQGEQWGGICEVCNRSFNVSVSVARSSKDIKCCYCGHDQDMQMALNRYTYAVQQQEAQQNAQLGAEFVQRVHEINQQTYQNQQAVLNRPTPQLAPKTTTCRRDGLGGVKCTEGWSGF
jgi:hypothetical protein